MALRQTVVAVLRYGTALLGSIFNGVRDLIHGRKMKPRKTWLHPAPGEKATLWNCSSRIVCMLVSSFSKIWLEKLNKTEVYNKEQFLSLLDERRKGRGLVTVSNHYSCMDDPFLWGMRKWKHAFNNKDLRWTPSAEEITFTTFFTARFFSLGRCVPVVRGNGVYQKGMDFCLDKLNNGGWVHMFPEGKVNLDKTVMRLKWGVGRLVVESVQIPIVLPIYHIGMDDILPNKQPYIPQICKDVTIVVGDPVDYTETVEKLRSLGKTLEEQRKHVTDDIQEILYQLRQKAEQIHSERMSKGR